jgi:hypothetical protein
MLVLRMAGFAVIRGVKSRTLKDKAGTRADKPLDFLMAFRAVLLRFGLDAMRNLVTMSADCAFVFVSRHLSYSV